MLKPGLHVEMLPGIEIRVNKGAVTVTPCPSQGNSGLPGCTQTPRGWGGGQPPPPRSATDTAPCYAHNIQESEMDELNVTVGQTIAVSFQAPVGPVLPHSRACPHRP